MSKRIFILILPLAILLSGCLKSNEPIAYGNFEAREWIISSAGKGEILSFPFQEGDVLTQGQTVAQIDTVELSMKKDNLDDQIAILKSSLPDVAIQIEVLKQKRKAMEKEYQRINNLVRSGATGQNKLDKMDDELKLVDRQIDATLSSLHRETAGILAQIETLRLQRENIAYHINKCSIRNPENGTLQLKYSEIHEFTDIGRPLYKLMDTREMILHSWFPGELISSLRINDEVKIGVDHLDNTMHFYTGRINYIAEKPEFTPSQVQTRKNRSFLLYHVKISVENDDVIKPGMPAEIFLQPK